MLESYACYAESAVGKFGLKPNGSPVPTLRTVVKPLLALFHGDKGCKRWKRTLDAGMKTDTSVAELIQV